MEFNWTLGISSRFAALFGRASDMPNSHTYTKSDWQSWTAALVTDSAVRDQFISDINKYLADGESNSPLGDWYDTVSGSPQSFKARPVVGGHLALVSESP